MKIGDARLVTFHASTLSETHDFGSRIARFRSPLENERPGTWCFGVKRCGWSWLNPHFELSCVLRDRYIHCISTLTEIEKWKIGANWTRTVKRFWGDYSDDCVCFSLGMKQRVFAHVHNQKKRKWEDTVSGHLGNLPWSQAWISKKRKFCELYFGGFLGRDWSPLESIGMHDHNQEDTNDLPARSILPTTYACFKG